MTLRDKITHPLRTADAWWIRKSPQRRLDRDGIAICAQLGFLGPTLSVALIGPAPASVLTGMGPHLQVSMCICIVVGLGIMLHGSLCGFPWYFPNTPVKRSYTRGYTGAPAAVIGLSVYAYYIITNTQTWSSALSAGVTPLLALGITIQAVLYWLEVRRIENVEDILIANAKGLVVEDAYNDDP